MPETYTSATLPPMQNWDKVHWHGMSKKQQESCPRISIGYKDRWGKKVTVRTIPACLDWEQRVKTIFSQLDAQGKTDIWFDRWEPKA